jgi:hypothetical protein
VTDLSFSPRESTHDVQKPSQIGTAISTPGCACCSGTCGTLTEGWCATDMAIDLRKFVNPKFTNTADLGLLRRLLERHQNDLGSFDMAVFDGDAGKTRNAIREFFAGPEDGYPEGLIVDLHQIAEVGDANGLQLIIEQAKRHNVMLLPANEDGGFADAKQDPKHVALRMFLDYPDVFNGAVAVLAYRTMSSLIELAGEDEGIEADTDEVARSAFERQAAGIFEANLRGRYCRAQCYEDGGEINVVVTHGALFRTTDTVDRGKECVIGFRELEHAVLCYSPTSGRLKIGAVAKAHRQDIAEAFAAEMLKRPGFFSAPGAQNLYTLAPVERAGFRFAFQHDFDPTIRRVQITEVQADRTGIDRKSGEIRTFWSIVARDGRDNALARLGGITQGIGFTSGDWRLNHVVIRVHFDVGATKPAILTVKIKPPAAPIFKRQRFEGRIMTLLRHNGIAHDQ